MSSKLSQLCDKYQAIVFFDTETTGWIRVLTRSLSWQQYG